MKPIILAYSLLVILAWTSLSKVCVAAEKAQATINLSVDATEAQRMILHSQETISVSPGTLTLFYPK